MPLPFTPAGDVERVREMTKITSAVTKPDIFANTYVEMQRACVDASTSIKNLEKYVRRRIEYAHACDVPTSISMLWADLDHYCRHFAEASPFAWPRNYKQETWMKNFTVAIRKLNAEEMLLSEHKTTDLPREWIEDASEQNVDAWDIAERLRSRGVRPEMEAFLGSQPEEDLQRCRNALRKRCKVILKRLMKGNAIRGSILTEADRKPTTKQIRSARALYRDVGRMNNIRNQLDATTDIRMAVAPSEYQWLVQERDNITERVLVNLFDVFSELDIQNPLSASPTYLVTKHIQAEVYLLLTEIDEIWKQE